MGSAADVLDVRSIIIKIKNSNRIYSMTNNFITDIKYCIFLYLFYFLFKRN